jgi:hypothetical protein
MVAGRSSLAVARCGIAIRQILLYSSQRQKISVKLPAARLGYPAKSIFQHESDARTRSTHRAAALVCICFAVGALFCRPVNAAVLVGTGLNFTGSTFGLNDTEVPPDTEGAVGPSHFVELINGRFAAYRKSNGSLATSMTDSNFWVQAGITFPTNRAITDPRILYDPSVQRWFAAEIDFDVSGVANTNHFLLAVSATSDPTGAWKAVSIASDPGGNNSADFPTLGLDAAGVYLSADLFDVNGNPVGSTLLSLPKAGLLLTTPVITNRTWFGVLSYASRGNILQPAVAVDGSSGGNVLSTGGLGYDLNTGKPVTDTTLKGCNVQNAAGPGSATLSSSTTPSVPGYTAPFPPYQPDDTQTLDPGDCRFSASIYRVGGVLFAAHSTVVSGFDAIRWYRINATNYAVLESGTISASASMMDLYYPSIAANTNETVVIGLNGSSTSSYISCYAVVGQTVNGVTTFGDLMLLRAGNASYQNIDPVSGLSRWGDYSATSVDPSDPNTFWTIQTYPSSSSAWSTRITQLFTLPGPVRLSASLAGANVVISWPGSAALLQLQSSPVLGSGASWSAVTQTPVTVGNITTVQVPISGAQQSFRLVASP